METGRTGGNSRAEMIGLLNETYKFFKVETEDVPLYSQNGQVDTIPFLKYFRLLLEGKAYKENEASKEIILAFEKEGPIGERNYRDVRENIEGYVRGGSIEKPVELKP